MKRSKKLILLVAVLAVLIGVIIAEKAVVRHVDQISTVDEVVIAEDADSLTTMSWTKDNLTLTFAKTDGVWHDSADADFPVDQQKAADFLANFADVHADFIIDDVDDLGQYGLDKPECTVTLTGADSTLEIQLGGYSTMDEKRYISIGDGKVYLIHTDLMDCISTDRDDFMQQDEIPAADTLTSLQISGDINMDICYSADEIHSYTDTYHYWLVDGSTYRALKDSYASSYISTLTGLSLTDYAAYAVTEEGMAEYGLDNPCLNFTVTGTNPAEDEESDPETVTYTIHIGKIVTESETEGEDPTVTAYLRLNDSTTVYNLSSSNYSTLSAGSYDTLRPKEVFSLDWDTVTGCDFTFDDGTTAAMKYGELPAEESTDADTSSDAEAELGWVMNAKEVSVDSLESAISSLKIDTFTSETAERELEFAMTVYLDNTDYPTLTVECYRYDGDYVLTFLNGECLGLMERILMVNLREAATGMMLSAE